jgi:hypothetical protein
MLFFSITNFRISEPTVADAKQTQPLVLAGGDYFGDSMNEKKWQTYAKNGENPFPFRENPFYGREFRLTFATRKENLT